MRHNSLIGTAIGSAVVALLVITSNVQAAAPVINSPSSLTVTAGVTIPNSTTSYTISGTNNPTAFNATGLPTGLSVDPTTGKISGATNVVGTTSVTISASNASGTGTATLTLTVLAAPPHITSPLSATGSLGRLFTYTVTASGIPAPTFTASPLPPGLTFNGTQILGTPTQGGSVGPANFTVTLTATNTGPNNSGGTDTQTLSINISAPPVITSPLIIPVDNTQAVNTVVYTIQGTNGPMVANPGPVPPASTPFKVTGLHSGLSFNPNTGDIFIDGNPLVPETYTAVIQCCNALNPDTSGYVFNLTHGVSTATVTIAVSAGQAPAITSLPAATGVETIPFVYAITGTHAPTSYSIVGGNAALPPGLTLNTTTGIISGVPNLITLPGPQVTNVTIVATNSVGSSPTTSTNLQITINAAVPVLLPIADQVALTNTPFQLQASLVQNFTNPSTFYNSGPGGGFAAPPTQAVNYTLLTTPVPASGNYSISAANGLFSGTATSGDIGSYVVTLMAQNARGSSTTTFNLDVVSSVTSGGQALFFKKPFSQAPIVGVPFTFQPIVSTTSNLWGFFTTSGPGYPNGPAFPNVFPGHLVLNPTSGFISGTPQPSDNPSKPLPDTYTVDISVPGATHTYTFVILPTPPQPLPPSITSAPPQGLIVGTSVPYTITTTPLPSDPTKGQLPLFISATPLPAGLSLNPNQLVGLSDPNAAIVGFPTLSGATDVSITALNAGGSDTKRVTYVIAPITIYSPATASGTIGVPFSYQIVATGNTNFYTASPLPPGLTLDPHTGIISGIPSDPAAVTTVNLTASNGNATGSGQVVITINPSAAGSPVITSLLTATAIDSQPFTYTITASPAAFASNGFSAVGLPNGLNCDPNTGIISGQTNQLGTYNVTLVATNASGSDAKILVLTVNPAPPVFNPNNVLLSSPVNVPFLGGNGYTVQVASGSNPIFYSLAPSSSPLPPGLTLNGNIINGTPTQIGAFTNIAINATNASNVTATLILNITITQTPKITNSLSASGVVGDPFSFNLTATGSPTISFNISPPGLPAGFVAGAASFSGGVTTETISGTPTTPGIFSVLFNATNSVGSDPASGTDTLLITVSPFVITSPILVPGVLNQPVSYTITTNSASANFSASGLPSWLTLNGNVLSGTPNAAGPFQVTVTATNAGGATATQNVIFAISTVPGAPAIFSPLLQPGVVNVPLTYNILATNTPTSYSATGLPPGLSVDVNSGIISGTPTTIGSTAVTITASNAAGSGSATLTIAVASVPGGPAISSPLVASVLQGSPFTYTITTINPTIPTIYGASGLPAGAPPLTVNPATGVISGTPTVPGVFNITLQVQTLVGQVQATLVLTVIQQSPKITSQLAVSTPVGVPFTYTITVTGAPTIVITAAPMPPGLSFSSPTISGTPTVEGTYSVTLTATNSFGTDTQTLVITVTPAPPVITSSLNVNAFLLAGFNYVITAGGSQPITFSATNLPPGLTFDGVNTIQGVPSQEGVFPVNLTATNALGSDNEILTITVNPFNNVIGEIDTDGDGFPDVIETAVGTDPNSATSFPFAPDAVSITGPINVVKITIGLDFSSATSTKDSMSLSGSFAAPKSTPISNSAIVFVAGVTRQFNISGAKLSLPSSKDSFKVKSLKNKTDANGNPAYSFQLKLGPNNFKKNVAPAGLLGDQTIKKPSARVADVIFYFHDTVNAQTVRVQSAKVVQYKGKAHGKFTATAAKTGTGL